ncbi:MAG TPA: FHA domain-containing protein [Capillibacterium sp.]
MDLNKWVLPWRKRRKEGQGQVGTGGQGAMAGDETKVFARMKDRCAAPSLALVVTKGPDAGREFLLAPMNVKIGRQAQSHIQLKDPKVSREHAVLQYYGRKRAFLLKDLGSTNGTYYNNRRITSIFIAPGAEIRLGESVLRVMALGEKKTAEQAEEPPAE